jgi:hypothetical protein
MRIFIGCACAAVVLGSLMWIRQAASATNSDQTKQPASTSASGKLTETLESNVKTEWEAFKNKDKQAYGNLLAEDFNAVEDDNQGMRKKSAATAEVDHSVVNNYHLFAFNVIPIDPNAALVTYELTLEFPPKALVKFKRVLVSELWLKRDGQWKERYYQETHVR